MKLLFNITNNNVEGLKIEKDIYKIILKEIEFVQII